MAKLSIKGYRIGWQYYVSLLLILALGIHMRVYPTSEALRDRKQLSAFPRIIGKWKMIDERPLGQDILDILKVDDYLMRDYSDGSGVMLSLYIGYYATHRRSAEIHTPENCQAGGGWEILSEQEKTVSIPGRQEPIRFIEALYEKDGDKMIFIYWYNVNGRFLTSFFEYKMNVILNSLLYHRSDASFVRIAVPVIDDIAVDGASKAEKFLSDSVFVIEQFT
jgi:EpsI family protein